MSTESSWNCAKGYMAEAVELLGVFNTAVQPWVLFSVSPTQHFSKDTPGTPTVYGWDSGKHCSQNWSWCTAAHEEFGKITQLCE